MLKLYKVLVLTLVIFIACNKNSSVENEKSSVSKTREIVIRKINQIESIDVDLLIGSASDTYGAYELINGKFYFDSLKIRARLSKKLLKDKFC